MREIVAISLSLLLLTSTFKDMVLLVSFKINQQQIAAEFCINKEEVIPMCQGSCFLINQLEIEHDQEMKFLVSSSKQVLFYSNIAVPYPELNQDKINSGGYFQTKNQLLDGYLSGVFHPPKS